MKNIKKESTIVSKMIFAVTLIATVIATYAFFAAQVTGTDASTSVYFATANQGITITFEGGDQVNLSNIYPRAEAWLEKDITIRSTAISSDVTSIYTFNMVVEENGYHPEDIKYTFTPKTFTGVEADSSTGTSTLTNLDNRIDIGHGLVKGTSEAEITYTLKVYFVNDATRNQNTGSAMSAKFYVTYNWGTATNFELDSWAEIAANVQTETGRSKYKVGDTRKITLISPDSTINEKTYTLRLANNSNYNCTLESKTACGFVVEFQDIITTHRMNANTNNTNVGGWPAIEMRDYLNGTFEGSETTQNPSAIINALPSDLRAVIIDTEVISGHGSSDSNPSRADGNWTSTDKLYLLSTREVWGDCSGGTNDLAGCWDSASLDTITRQQDYYANLGVVKEGLTNYKDAKKHYNGTNTGWWLRSATYYGNRFFRGVDSYGGYTDNSASNEYGVAPAFRIG